EGACRLDASEHCLLMADYQSVRPRDSGDDEFTNASARLREIPQVGRRLIFPRRHQEAIDAEEIIFVRKQDVMVVLRAGVFEPLRGSDPCIAAPDGPWPRERVVVRGDFIVEGVAVCLVEPKLFFQDRLVVLVQWDAVGVKIARTLEAARLD